MSEMERVVIREEIGPHLDTGGEPHPADLLASLLRAEAATSQSTVAAPPKTSDIRFAAHPSAAESQRMESVSAAARALAAPAVSTESQDNAAMQRTVQTIRSALPILQRLLPLIDGNMLGALAGMLAPHPQSQPIAKPVDLTQVENGLAELKKQQQELRGQLLAQDSAVGGLADLLERVREVTDRNSREQEDLIDELKASGRKMNVVAFFAFALLAASIAMNVVLYLEFHRLLP